MSITSITTYEQIERMGYPVGPGIEKLLLEQEYNLRLMACALFDIWYSTK